MAAPFPSPLPGGAVSLESILCTEELRRRPSRPPDYEKENRALVALVSALADSPSTILQTLAETTLDITQCDSAGLSLLTRDGGRPDAHVTHTVERPLRVVFKQSQSGEHQGLEIASANGVENIGVRPSRFNIGPCW